MRKDWIPLLPILSLHFLLVCSHDSDVKHYTNKWFVHVPLGEEVAKEVARLNDMLYEGPVK